MLAIRFGKEGCHVLALSETSACRRGISIQGSEPPAVSGTHWGPQRLLQGQATIIV